MACPSQCYSCAFDSQSAQCQKDEGHTDEHQCPNSHIWAADGEVHVPPDMFDLNTYPALKAINDSADIDSWLSNVVGIDPSILASDDDPQAVS